MSYAWERYDVAFGPGAGCHYDADLARINYLISTGVLLPNHRPVAACAAGNTGHYVIVWDTCGGWGASGIEGYSGWRCEGSDGSGWSPSFP